MISRETRRSLWRLWRPILCPVSAKDWAGAIISWICIAFITAQIMMLVAIWRGWIS